MESCSNQDQETRAKKFESDDQHPEHQEKKSTVLKQELEVHTEPPSGLSLLVAAVDARDSEIFAGCRMDRPNSGLSMDGCSSSGSHSPNYSGNSTEMKNGRRRSIPDAEKDEFYWEKRRRNNEAAKKSREKRRINDMAMESKLLELSKENNLLKNELNSVIKKPPVKPEPQLPPPVHQPKPVPLPRIPQQPTTGCMPFTRVPSQAAPAETMLPNPPIPTNPVTGLPTMPPLNQNSPALTAALNANPAAALPHSLLTAMLPPSALLQQLSHAYSQAHAVALLAAQQPGGLKLPLAPNLHPPVCSASQSLPILTGHLSTSGPAPIPVKQASPDSTVERILSQNSGPNSAAELTGHRQPNSSMDGKQYLRYKLLERQNRRLNTPAPTRSQNLPNLPNPTPSAADSSFRETVITKGGQKNTCNGESPAISAGQLSVKQCLSSLAVHLGSSDPSTTTGSGSGRSDSSITGSEGSQISPASSHESSLGQPSPPQAILDALGISHENSKLSHHNGHANLTDSERYIERRRRNNEAAKRCRANRRALFEYRFKRAQELEQENVQLKEEMQRLTRELMELKELLARKNGRNGILPTSTAETSGFLMTQEPRQVGVQNDQNFVQNGGVHTPPSGHDLSGESGNEENMVDTLGVHENGNASSVVKMEEN